MRREEVFGRQERWNGEDSEILEEGDRDILESPEEEVHTRTQVNHEKRAHLRDRGYKRNNKPLIWKTEIEEYIDEPTFLNDGAVLKIFTEKVERAYTPRRLRYDLYYKNLPLQSDCNTNEEELMEGSKQLIESQIVTVRERLRLRIKEENCLLHKSKRLHVVLKQFGYMSGASSIYALLAKSYVTGKRAILTEMEVITNRLSSLYARILIDARYLQKCSEFLERKTIIM
ncbi:hypothetical protein NEDG_00143 [Nematocida displodere]|uniref:Uncharacterized protein n=1 Tax=Nematocida displodere TaxID=1805483 RepID=A0A177EIF6_9MICR|nr:hypothetical protein NEDG_00143 [Nematocida displodere]